MNCKKCGAPLVQNARFCAMCGEKVEIEEEMVLPHVKVNAPIIPEAPEAPLPGVLKKEREKELEEKQELIEKQQQELKKKNENEQPKKSKLPIIIIIILIIIGAILAIMLLFKDKFKNDNSKGSTTTKTTTTVVVDNSKVNVGSYTITKPTTLNVVAKTDKFVTLANGDNTTSVTVYPLPDYLYNDLLNDTEVISSSLSSLGIWVSDLSFVNYYERAFIKVNAYINDEPKTLLYTNALDKTVRFQINAINMNDEELNALLNEIASSIQIDNVFTSDIIPGLAENIN